MNIVVLAHNLSAGGGRYLGQSIVETLLRSRPQDRFLISCPSAGWQDFSGYSNATCLAMGLPFSSPARRLFRETFVLRRAVRDFRPDLIFAAGNFGFINPPCRQIVLVHEPHLAYDARHYGPLPLRLRLQIGIQKPYFRAQLRKTDLVFAQTNVMAGRVRTRYGFRGGIRILPNILTPNHARADVPSEEIAERVLANGKDFRLAYITRYYAHKNLEGLVDAFAKHNAELDRVKVFITIDRTGADGGGRVLRRLSSSPARSHIVNLGPIPQASVGWLLKNVDAVIVPSLLESFSAAYLEAMQHGLPIVTSDLDFAHEVCGDAALYCDPWSTAEVSATIRRVRDDASLRTTLADAGRARLRALGVEQEAFQATLNEGVDGNLCGAL